MKKLVVLLMVLGLIIGGGSLAQANLIENGDFEILDSLKWYGLYNVPSWTVIDPSSTPATGVYNGAIFGLAPHGGVSFLYGGAWGGNIGEVSQTLTTGIGQNYELEFFLANAGNTPNAFSVSWSETVLNSIINSAPPSDYVKYSYLVAGTGNDTLKFSFNQEPTAWALDDVSVNAVPEPATMLLLGFGLIGVSGVRRITKRK